MTATRVLLSFYYSAVMYKTKFYYNSDVWDTVMILYVICQLVCVMDPWAHTSFVHSILSLKLGMTPSLRPPPLPSSPDPAAIQLNLQTRRCTRHCTIRSPRCAQEASCAVHWQHCTIRSPRHPSPAPYRTELLFFTFVHLRQLVSLSSPKSALLLRN